MRGNVDLANVFNASDVLNVNTRYGLPNGGQWLQPVQILGGRGVTGESVVMRIFTDMRAFRIYDGPSEVHRWSMTRKIVSATDGNR